MAYNVTDALREMAEELKSSRPSTTNVVERKEKFTNPVDQFLIPESYMRNEPYRIGTITADYYELKDKFRSHADFPENPMLSDAYAYWPQVEVSGLDYQYEEESGSFTVYLEIALYDTSGTEVGKMYRGGSVTWEVFIPSREREYADQAKTQFNKQYAPLKIK